MRARRNAGKPFKANEDELVERGHGFHNFDRPLFASLPPDNAEYPVAGWGAESGKWGTEVDQSPYGVRFPQ